MSSSGASWDWAIQGVGRGNAHAGQDREIAAQNENLMTDEDAGPDACTETESKSESEGLGDEKDGRDQHVVDIEKETHPAGDGPSDRED